MMRLGNTDKNRFFLLTTLIAQELIISLVEYYVNPYRLIVCGMPAYSVDYLSVGRAVRVIQQCR
jgi:hypothetical protein